MPKAKALQCALALEIHSVTCLGVVLKDKKIYLSICVFGQYKKAQYVPTTFPLVFNARRVFEKFPEAVDPGDVVAQLESCSKPSTQKGPYSSIQHPQQC
uniref:Spermatogenesis-associated protein 6 N-terminal domain-containing protein n=1 Tax=Chinchilla lanigera TaxID=34839 RepID=A0A8C2UID1_CHILA